MTRTKVIPLLSAVVVTAAFCSFYARCFGGSAPQPGVVVTCSTDTDIYFKGQPICLTIQVKNVSKSSMRLDKWGSAKQPTSVVVIDEEGNVMPLTTQGKEHQDYVNGPVDFNDSSMFTETEPNQSFSREVWLNEFADFTSLHPKGYSNRGDGIRRFTAKVVFLGHTISSGSFGIMNADLDLRDHFIREEITKKYNRPKSRR